MKQMKQATVMGGLQVGGETVLRGGHGKPS